MSLQAYNAVKKCMTHLRGTRMALRQLRWDRSERGAARLRLSLSRLIEGELPVWVIVVLILLVLGVAGGLETGSLAP